MSKDGYGVEDLLALGRQFDAPREPDGEAVSTWLTRRWLRIRDRNGNEVPLQPNAVQALFAGKRGQQNIVLKARQMGITTWVAARFFLRTITARGMLTVQVAHTREAAEAIFDIVKRFYACLPEDLRKGALKTSRANVRQLTFPELDSEYRVLTASDENAGRGLTVQNMHLSEVARWPGDSAATLAGLRAALVPAGELVLESTPNGAGGCFYEEWQQAPEKGVVRHFFPWWLEGAYVSSPVTDMNDEELELARLHCLTAAQIGFRRSLEERFQTMRVQEFAEDPDSCFRFSGACRFDQEMVERCLRNAAEPFEKRHNQTLRIWLPAEPGKRYLVAADPCGGGSDGDFAALQIIDLDSGMQCAELRRRMPPQDLARQAAALGREYATRGKPALVVVESNNHGHAVIATLNSCEHYPSIYERNQQQGFATNVATKAEAIAQLESLLTNRPQLFRSERLLKECRTFVVRANGSCGAAGGAHDDLLMAMAIAQTVRLNLTGAERA